MDPIVMAFGTALVGTMATEVWQQARGAVVGLWRRVHPQQADTMADDLETLRGQVLDARQAGQAEMEQALVGSGRGGCSSCCWTSPAWPPSCGRSSTTR